MKATSVVVNNERREIFKAPITDSGVKKSAKGLVKVIRANDEYTLIDQVSESEEKGGELKLIFEDGVFYNTTTLEAIRNNINKLV